MSATGSSVEIISGDGGLASTVGFTFTTTDFSFDFGAVLVFSLEPLSWSIMVLTSGALDALI